MLLKNIITSVLSTFIPVIIYSQSTGIGLAQSNYNVIESVYLNPASSADPKPYFDLHIFGSEHITSSDYVKFNANKFGPFNGKVPDNSVFDPKKSELKLNTENKIFGPGFNYSIERYSVGFNSSIREYVNIERLIPELATTYLADNPDYPNTTSTASDIKIDYFKWEEIGIHGGAILYKKGFDMVNGGINIKILRPTMISSLRIDQLNYTADNTANLTLNSIDGQLAQSINKGRAGWGAAIDIGFQYKKTLEGVTHYIPHSFRHNCKSVDYKYKFGISLLDVGILTLNNDVMKHNLKGADISLSDYSGIEENKVESFVSEMNEALASSHEDTLRRFNAMPPTALSMQYDYNTGRNFYFNLSGLYGFNRNNSLGPERISWLAASYRYERAKYEMSTSLSYNSLNEVGLGAAIRVWVLSIGTHNILPFLQDNAYSTSVYFHLRFSLLSSNKCVSETGEPMWRFSDCSGPKKDSHKGKNFRGKRKSMRRNKRRTKQYRS